MINLNLPPDIEQKLREDFPNLERRMLEGFVIYAYSKGKISSFQAGQLLGLNNRWQIINFLSEHGVYPNYDVEQLEEDRAAHARVFGNRNK